MTVEPTKVPTPAATSIGKAVDTYSARAVDMITEYEGFSRVAYEDGKDSKGNILYSVGYGTIASKGETIAEPEARRRMMLSVNGCRRQLREQVKVPLNQNMFDALMGFCYNLKHGTLLKSTMLEELNNGDYTAVTRRIQDFGNFQHKPSKGLLRRRTSEKMIWLGMDNWKDAKGWSINKCLSI